MPEQMNGSAGGGCAAQDEGSEPSEDIRLLKRLWRQALKPGQTMPWFEDVAIGNLGRLTDHIAIVSSRETSDFTILRAGSAFESWIDGRTGALPVSELRTDCARSFMDLMKLALDSERPVHAGAHGVQGNHVSTYDMAALPMQSRWGAPMLLAYCREREAKYNLIDAMFAAIGEGLLALAAIRDTEGRAYDFQIVALNEGAARLVRRPLEEIRWQRISDIFSQLDRTGAMARLLAALEEGGSDQFELEQPVPGAVALHLGVSISTMGDLLTATLTDIGDLKTREASFRLLFESNPVPMWVFDPDSLEFLAVNDAAISHYGYGRDDFLSMTLMDIRPQEEHAKLLDMVRNGMELDGAGHPWRHVTADGGEIEVISYARSITFQGRAARLVAVIDVTERRQAEKRISHMAHHDALTDLPNRVLFRKALDEALARVRRHSETVAVLCLDLDHFKGVNDTLGHPVGDALLKEVSARLKGSLRETDVVARLGGDEFAVIQGGVRDPAEAGAFAARLVDLVSEPYEVDGHQLVVGASVGIALAPGDSQTADALLKSADMALYRAKEDGRRTYRYFERAMDERIQARRAMELDLRKGLAAGEFELHYQPQIGLKTGAITGFEALLRWRHPGRGMVSPADFIPLTEEIGLIGPLGEWVLRRACADAAAWPEDVRVAVNLSPVQFQRSNLPEAVADALSASGLSPGRLELEITESVLLTESDANLAVLHQLRELGVRISMDDFGTGYSSLSYLRAFPFDKIKIDKSFVQELAESGDCMAIVRAVAGLGTSLGITTTAEGVETAEQLERLRQEGCTEVQGYLFSPPRPLREVAALLADLRPGSEVYRQAS